MFWTKNAPLKFVRKSVSDSLSSTFAPREIEELSSIATLVDIDEGQKLTVEGTTGREVLVIVSGTASVLRGAEVVASVGPGQFVGEIASLSGARRNATVVADTDMTVYAMSNPEFSALLTRCPLLERRVTTGAVRRLADAKA